MRTSERGRAFIAAHEGTVLRAYRCPAGRWTIGVGHTSAAGAPDVRPGMTITPAEAGEILARDLARFELRVKRRFGAPPQTVFDGAVSFDFNTGAIERASWVARFQAGDNAGAETSLKAWNKAGGRVLSGLVRRRGAEADLIFRGRYGDVEQRQGRGVPPAWSASADQIAAWQRQLAGLGYAPGPIDGLAGPRTIAAIRAFQRAHPDLVEDGIVGPATRAALTRMADARRKGATAALGGAGGAAAAGAAADQSALCPPVLAAAIVVAMAIAAIAVLAWRYRDAIAERWARIEEAL